MKRNPITTITISNMKFDETDTGGGCKALEFTHDNGCILITDDAALPTSMNDKVNVGFYNEDGDCIGSFFGATLKQLVNQKIQITY